MSQGGETTDEGVRRLRRLDTLKFLGKPRARRSRPAFSRLPKFRFPNSRFADSEFVNREGGNLWIIVVS